MSRVSSPSSTRASARRASYGCARPALRVDVVDLLEDRLDPLGQLPAGIVPPELLQVADPPAVVADPRVGAEVPVELASGDPLTRLDRLEHRAVRLAAPAHVVDRGRTRGSMELEKRLDQVRRGDVVPHLLALVAVDRVVSTGDDALHQVGEEAMEPRPRVGGPRDAPATQANRRHVEVAAVLLDEQ